MSKQYLTLHTVDQAHKTGIFSLAPTPTSVISASGSSALHIHNTTEPSFPLQQSLEGAHKLGCHHVCTARDGPGNVFASVGFGSEIKVWRNNKESGKWELWWELPPSKSNGGDVWAVALSSDENYLAFTTSGGKIHVWDLTARERIRTYDTGSGSGSGTAAGSFAMAVDLSRDGKLTASGHENGGVYVFNNDTGKLAYSLSGLAKPVRAVAFSPGCKRLAAAGNAGVIALYDMVRGEHVQNLSALSTAGFNSWITSIDWNDTGDYLLSGSLDGRVRVWDVNREACVATHSESDGVLWSVRWLPKTERALAPGMGKGELFCAAGESKNITFYREATGI